MHKRWLYVLVGYALVLAGCKASLVPYDRADARYVVDVTMGRLFYDDGPIQIHGQMDVYSARHKRQMAPPAGNFAYTYTLTFPSGQEQRYRQENRNAGQWVGDLKTLPGAPKYLPPGKYRLSIAALIPDGKKVRGNFVREFTIRPRELRVDLASDKKSYAAGDVIKITAYLTNLTDKDIAFAERKPARCHLISKWGHDSMDLTDEVKLPVKLKQAGRVRLWSWESVAGKPDPRFKMGDRREWFPRPFGRKGEYELVMSLSGKIKAPAATGSSESTLSVAAVPGRLKLEVTSVLPHQRGR